MPDLTARAMIRRLEDALQVVLPLAARLERNPQELGHQAMQIRKPLSRVAEAVPSRSVPLIALADSTARTQTTPAARAALVLATAVFVITRLWAVVNFRLTFDEVY